VQGSPPLLNQLMAKGEVDAMLQFSSLTLGPIKAGEQREAIAAKIGFTDPAVVVAYRNLARQTDNPPYNRSLIAPTQALVDAISAIAGSTAVGFTTVDPAAFLFPNETRH
jgi:hypothetical protein